MKNTDFESFLENIKTIFSGNREHTETTSQRPVKLKKKSVLFCLIVTVLVMFVYFFFSLPSLSPMTFGLYSFLAIGIGLFLFLDKVFSAGLSLNVRKYLISAIVILLIIPIVGGFLSSHVFRAKSYYKLISVEEKAFEENIEEINFNKIPIVDRSAARIIGSKQMGVMTDLVSQFEIDDVYSQVNIAGKPIRVSPLRYSDLFKYLGNFKNGIPAYVSVDMTSQEAKVKRLDKPIKYSKSDYLLRNIDRHIRFSYPFLILGETNFELNDDGDPFYVTPVITKKIGFFGGEDIESVIITDANSGENKRYDVDEVPTWVDRVYPAEIIISQLNSYGKFKNGFINTLFSQKNVTRTTEGYNYISIGEDIYLITGVTSVRSDESNLGFYFVNLRTKEANFYPVSSATEVAAMASAKGKVQEKNYNPTFPIVINLKNRPVYFMSLKDAAGVAKMYALVDAQQFTSVIVGESVDKLIVNYLKDNTTKEEIGDESITRSVEVDDIKSVIIDGNTVFYLKVKNEETVFISADKSVVEQLLFVEKGDTIKVTGNKYGDKFHILKVE